MKSVRLRLLVLALLPLVVLLPILLAVTMIRWAGIFDGLLISKVASDLRIAEQYMQRIVTLQGNQIAGLAGSTAFLDAANAGDEQLTRFLARSRDTLGLDYLVIRQKGQELAPEITVAEHAIAKGAATSIDLFTFQDLEAISPKLARRARIPLIKTKAAIPTVRTSETRGMVVLGATPVEVYGRPGVLIGGTLLNRNLDFIDTINKLVYPDENGERNKTGTATLFLEDVRISTNVRLFGNTRALGTRVSAAVYKTVLNEGRTWLNRAFVVNDWYISGYLPIVDSRNKRIGMLYVGFLESPFVAMKNNIYLVLVTSFIFIIALSIPFFLWIARGIFSPLEQMNQTMQLVEKGNLDARITDVKSKDEIGEVAKHLNTLLDQVQERDQKLRDWADTLNDKVDQRTIELHQANVKLEETYKQLMVSEKLASIGEITAGVAHEINNPVAVIQGNMDVMRVALGKYSLEYQNELDLVDAQVFRISSIVGKLLQFAKPGDFADCSQQLDIASVLEDCLILTQHSQSQAKIEVVRNFDNIPLVRMDQGELQQILINLLTNAFQAMPDGGILGLEAHAAPRDGQSGAEIIISDNGGGISQDRLDQIFDPFFTTKRGEGTGLGLSISQSLIQRVGGLIMAHSDIGKGSKFIMWIPAAREMSQLD